ncbi:MAG: ABC transporter ATP-binding protein, partial [Pseudomonadales bacterium]|nr:ABC transporter ATP-binding protein [Pseudomonadales bacterium]
QVIHILIAQAGYYGIPAKVARVRAEEHLKALGLWDRRFTPARMLSGGMKRRLMIARALIHNPRLLILDEPTAGVDIEMRRSLWEFLQRVNEQGTTIILTTHYLEEAESLCRNIAIIDKGVIVQNSSMKSLLKQLKEETFIFDTEQTLPQSLQLEGFNWVKEDEQCLSVSVVQGQSINAIFSMLTEQGVNVLSMRNRSNRLEELFVKLVEGGRD